MIKNLYLLLFLLLTASYTSSAQRNVDLQLLPTRMSTTPGAASAQPITQYQQILYDAKTEYYVWYQLANLGSDTLQPSDTVHFKVGSGGVIKGSGFSDGSITAGYITHSNSPFIFSPAAGVPLPYVDTLQWCDSIWITGPASAPVIDPDMSNNYFCRFLEIHAGWAVGINDISLQENGFTIYPNPATDNLVVKVETRLTGGATITVRDMLGKTVYSHSLGDASSTTTHTIDVSRLPRGVYTAELHHNNQTLFRKLSIQ